jgi:UPF0755 protein
LKRLTIKLFAAAALVAVIGLASAGVWIYSEIEEPFFGAQANVVFVDIPRGSSANEAAELLFRAGILKHRLPFRIYLRYANAGRHIQAGEYRFTRPATPKQIVQRLIRGDVFFHSITIPEGLTASETIALLAKNNLGDPAGLERALLKTDWIADLDPGAKNLEGYLFPETYRFRRKTDSGTIIKTMIDQFRAKMAKISSLYPMREGWSISKVVILASMIEKEVKKPEEGPLVASVLINRLNIRMPLACDATPQQIRYGNGLALQYLSPSQSAAWPHMQSGRRSDSIRS